MSPSARIAAVAVVSLAVLAALQAGPAASQAPEAAKNLKVLPSNMPRREVIGIMRDISGALGVRCIECHVSTRAGSERPEDMDFASDQKPTKETARKMMKLVNSINDQIGMMGLQDAAPVRCVTCHHGVKRPETLTALLIRTYEKGGAAAAVDTYRKLREQYLGTAAYDFSPGTLDDVAMSVAEHRKDYDGAIRLLQLNLETAAKHAETHAILGRVLLAKGDKAAGIASLEKALELDPGHRWAKQQLERARSGQ